MNTIETTITTAAEVKYHGEAISVTAPGTAGEMTILPHHMPLITSLKAGVVVVRLKDENKEFKIDGGLLQVDKNKIIVIAR